MAVDKLVDSTQLDADLTSVANAIRTKGGTSGQLAFPAGFVQAIGDISGGGDTDFTAEWERPSDWPALPNDIGTYSGMYFLYKIETGKTVYRIRLRPRSQPVDVGTTDAAGNFTSLLTVQPSSETFQTDIDISGLQLGDYFWVRGAAMFLGIDRNIEVMFEPVVESIISNCGVTFYEDGDGVAINARTVHFLANKWTSTYAYNFDYGQNVKCALQCVEFYGGSWNNDIIFPINCNKIVIDGVAASVYGGKIFGNSSGRGNSQYGYARYASAAIGTSASLRMNFCGGSTEEAQSLLEKLGDLSGVTNFSTFWNGAFRVTSLDFTGNSITNATNFDNAFSNCQSLRTITWGESDLSGITSLNTAFDNCYSLVSIAFPGTIHITQNQGMYLTFRRCISLETIDLSNIDFTSNVQFNQTFGACKSLKNLTFKANAGIAQNIELTNSEQLTVASLLSLFNALATVTAARTCKIGSTNLNKLTAEQKAIATDKGWTLA